MSSKVRFITLFAFFFSNTGGLFLRHSALLVLLIYLLYPGLALQFTSKIYRLKSYKNSLEEEIFNFFPKLIWLIVFLYPLYLIQSWFVGVSDSINYVSSFNDMLGYLLGLWSCGLLFFITVKEKKVLFVRHVFWGFVLLLVFLQLFTNNLYESSLVQLGFNKVDMLGRLPLSFEEPSSAAFYLFCFTLPSFFLYQQSKSKIDLYYVIIGLGVSLLLVESKAYYLYFAIFILCFLVYSLRDLKLKTMFYTSVIMVGGIYAFIASDFYYLLIDLFDNLNNIFDLVYAANMSISTRSFMLLEGINILPKYPFGTGWGMANDYLLNSLSNSSLIENREVLGMAFTGEKISTKTYLIDFFIALGIPGVFFLFHAIRRIHKRFSCILPDSKIFFVILIPVIFGGMLVEGFYFFFLLFYPFFVLVQHKKQNICWFI